MMRNVSTIDIPEAVAKLLGPQGTQKLRQAYAAAGSSTRNSIEELVRHLEKNPTSPFSDKNVAYTPSQTAVVYEGGGKRRKRELRGVINIKSKRAVIELI